MSKKKAVPKKIVPNRKELESTVCDIQKKLAEVDVGLRQKETALRHANEDLVEKRNDLAYHNRNAKFMDQKATVVDIKEYRGVLKLQTRAREEFEEVAIKVRNLSSAVAAYRRDVDGFKADIARIKGVIGTFGQLVTPDVPHWRKP